MRYLMYDSTVEFMVKRKKWGYDEEELEKVQKDYEQIKSIVDRYIKLGMLSQDGDYLLLRDKSLCNTVLACHLGTKVSSKRKLMDEVLRFGREHNTLVSGKKYDSESLWATFCLSEKNFSAFACSYILVSCSLSDDPEQKDFFRSQMLAVYRKERKLFAGLEKITFDMQTLVSWTSNLDLESALVYDYYLDLYKCTEAPLPIILTICAGLLKVKEHMCITGGTIPQSIRGSMKTVLMEAAQDMLEINLYRNSLTDTLRGHYGMDVTRLKEKDVLPGAYLAIRANEENFDIAPMLVLYTKGMEQFKQFCVSAVQEYLSIGIESRKTLTKETSKLKEQEEKILALTEKNQVLSKNLDTAEKNISHLEAEIGRLKKQLNQIGIQSQPAEVPTETFPGPDDINDSDEVLKEEKIDMDGVIHYLSSKRVLVIGGHERWVRNMQEYCPKWIYIIDSTRVFPRTQDIDFIVINTRSLSHGLFEKAMAFVKAGDLPKYLISYNNKDQLFFNIYHFAMSLDKNSELQFT